MTCHELDSFALPYLDGELEADARAEIEAHLAACTACARRVHEEARFHQALKARIRSAAALPASDALRARIHHGIRGQHQRQLTVRWVRVGAAAAAVVVVAAGTRYVYAHQNLKKVAQAAVFTHGLEDGLAMDVRDDPDVAQRLASSRLRQAVRFPGFPNYQFVGVRYSNMEAKPAAHAIYEMPGGQRVSLFVYNDADGEIPDEVELATNEGYNVALWREKETAYALVSDLKEADIIALLRARSNEPERVDARPVSPVMSPVGPIARPAALNAAPPRSACFPTCLPTIDLQPASFSR